MLQATNPYTEQTLIGTPNLSLDDMKSRIGDAHAAFPAWRDTSFADRAMVLKKVAGILRERKQALAELMAIEMGKPIKEGGPEVEKGAWCLEFYADQAEKFLQDEHIESDATTSYVTFQPLGTILGILPWNAPVWLAFRFLAPGLMAGNTCVMKHDPHVPGTAEALMQAFIDSGAPKDIMVNLPVETGLVEEAIRDNRIAAVSFTGSAVAGAKVAAVAGSEIKHCVLELGGSDPFIVMADADLEGAADIAVLSRIINAGQSCIAAKRILVEQPVYDQFIALCRDRLAKLKLGDPLRPETDIGPLARGDLRDNLHRQVTQTIQAGAKCLLGGEMPGGDGYFYPVTLLTDVTMDMPGFNEETFGPVMCAAAVSSIDDAIDVANQTEYGLGAAIWTKNAAYIEKAKSSLVAGQVSVNGIVKTDPRLPSGGVKRSGIGRELGPHGIKEFVNVKQIWEK